MNLLQVRTQFVDRYGLLHLVGDDSDVTVEEASLASEMNKWMISRLAGVSDAISDSGIFAFDTTGTDSLQVTASATPDYNITVNKGACFIKNTPVHLEDDTVLSVSPVTSLPRIDVVVIDTDAMLTVLQGTSATIPEAPAVGVGQFGLATITHVVGETSIKDADDATNAYITNVAVFCNA